MSISGIRPCCATGSLHTGTPTGKEIELHGLPTYIAEPPSGVAGAKGVVVIIPDIFGWTFANNRILADDYAKKGDFIVLLPDFMNGCIVPGNLVSSLPALEATGFVNNIKKIYHVSIFAYHLLPFFFWHNPDTTVRPRVLSFFRGLKSTYPSLSVGAAGFCWGGKWVFELCSARDRSSPPVSQAQPQSMGQSGGSGGPLVVCGFTAHPSRLKFPADVEAVEVPLSVAAAGHNDPQMSREQGEQTKGILEKKTEAGAVEGVEHEFVWFEGARHGFGVRADEEDVEEAERGRKAEAQAIGWFTRWFEKVRQV